MSERSRQKNAPASHSRQVVSAVTRGKVHRAGNIEVRPADEVVLALVVRAVDDQAVDEALEEDGGRARSTEATTSVAEVHAAGGGPHQSRGLETDRDNAAYPVPEICFM